METIILRINLVPPPGDGLNRSSLAGPGSEIVASFRITPFLPLRAEWIAYITEFEWNHHFADVQKKGPFRVFCHRHEFASETRSGHGGTLVRDRVEYDPGFGPLGRLARELFIVRQLKNTFLHRQKSLETLLAA